MLLRNQTPFLEPYKREPQTVRAAVYFPVLLIALLLRRLTCFIALL